MSIVAAPLQKSLWPGSVLASIAHAIFTCRNPSLAHEQSWDGETYNIQDSAGSRASVSFVDRGQRYVGVFFYEASDRNPFSGGGEYSLDQFFIGCPRALRDLANREALQYALQEYNGKSQPIITAALWADGEGEFVQAAEPWQVANENGAMLIANQFMDPNAGLKSWQADYDLSDDEVSFIESIWLRKMAVREDLIRLSKDERAFLSRVASDEDGAEAGWESFRELGILP